MLLGYVVSMETESPLPDCSRCKELEKQVAVLAAEVKRLAEKLESKTRDSKRSAAPQRVTPSRRKPPELHRTPGRPDRHEPSSKTIPEKIDQVVEVLNRDTIPTIEYANKIWDHQNSFHQWIEAHVENKCEATSRLARHLRDYEIEFTKHLHDRQIPPTNNCAEQTLRTAVLPRKIGCCSRSVKGIATFEDLPVFFATFAKYGKDIEDWTKESLIGPGPK